MSSQSPGRIYLKDSRLTSLPLVDSLSTQERIEHGKLMLLSDITVSYIHRPFT